MDFLRPVYSLKYVLGLVASTSCSSLNTRESSLKGTRLGSGNVFEGLDILSHNYCEHNYILLIKPLVPTQVKNAH